MLLQFVPSSPAAPRNQIPAWLLSARGSGGEFCPVLSQVAMNEPSCLSAPLLRLGRALHAPCLIPVSTPAMPQLCQLPSPMSFSALPLKVKVPFGLLQYYSITVSSWLWADRPLPPSRQMWVIGASPSQMSQGCQQCPSWPAAACSGVDWRRCLASSSGQTGWVQGASRFSLFCCEIMVCKRKEEGACGACLGTYCWGGFFSWRAHVQNPQDWHSEAAVYATLQHLAKAYFEKFTIPCANETQLGGADKITAGQLFFLLAAVRQFQACLVSSVKQNQVVFQTFIV